MVATASALYRLCGWYGVAFVHVRSPLPCELTASPQVAKVCVPLFLFSRRNKGDPLRCQVNERRCPTLQDTTDTPDARYVRSFYSVMLIIYRQLSVSDRTRLNPRPSSPGYQHFRPNGQCWGTVVVNTLHLGRPGCTRRTGIPPR